MKKFVYALLLVALGVLGRTVFHLAPNVEVVTLSTLLAATYLGGAYAVFVPLGIMGISDAIIGNSRIYLFTWSAYMLIGLGGLVLRRFRKKDLKLVGAATLFSIPSSLFFYLWTNFGVWVLGWYPSTWAGLIQCYVMGLPFLKLNLIGNLIFVPLGFGLVIGLRRFLLRSEFAPLFLEKKN